MNASLRSHYLEVFGIPEFLHIQVKNQDLNVSKINTQCLAIETNPVHSFCKIGKTQDFLFKMLGAIGLEKSNIRYVSANINDLNQMLKQYNAKIVLLMSSDLKSSSYKHFVTHHPSEVLTNEQLKRETWEVLKRVKQYLK
ncbi:hypothetical protein Rmag_0450 [Candidatus Ruthia magnifica str. Cm (Calyptogena magnifica)]|uniref:Uncharacterized protein n=1 Tax=Ruthia magnifica subsp. Calyptogena magnifica TaxID=413404 RepID=A1AWA2_RUTMC|nr:hypothetical protein [Candidatus Ruthturnera calyptogenae]ABL02209.1 hypothetical protein Rmag_0450 [Candidatus Ruthia magnifica str. Cm (Calyptogena magnifica)]